MTGDITSASVNGKTTSLLLDSGCEIPFIVHARLVRKRFYTGKTVRVRYLNGNVETLPQVSIVVDTPYVKGRVMAAVSKGMTQGLTLGSLCESNTQDGLSHQQGAVDNQDYW